LGDDPRAVDRVTPHTDLAAAVRDADYVVEAVSENLPLKQKLFAGDREARPPGTRSWPATLRSFRSPTSWAGLKRRDRALGTHWWNPPTLVPWSRSSARSGPRRWAIDFTIKLHADAGKTPVHVKKDVPGFVGNRLQHALWRECVALVQNGICDAETVDTVIKASFGRRLAVLGPLENADLVGTDLTLAIHNTVLPDLDRTPGALPYLQELVKAG
jgi:3-hydroxybutyryl-CoA dehydrogenase